MSVSYIADEGAEAPAQPLFGRAPTAPAQARRIEGGAWFWDLTDGRLTRCCARASWIFPANDI